MAYFLLHNGQPSARRLLSCVSELRKFTSAAKITGSDSVIRYGLSDESDPENANIINRQNAISRTASRSKMARILRKLGVHFVLSSGSETGEAARFIRHYRIPFFDLQPLSYFRADANMAWINTRIQRIQQSFREISCDEDKVAKRAGFLASRALHALGLDFGLVSLGLGPKGVLHVIDITPAPVLEERLLDLYTKAITNFIDREEKIPHAGVQSVVLGTDMEMMLRNSQGKLVLASSYFPRKGRVGCDDRSVSYDGVRLPLVELRPAPASDPYTIVEHLRDALLEGVLKINRQKVEWRAGSMPFRPYCTGGHIHFSNIPFSSRFVTILDNYIGFPLMAVENRETAQLRRPRYGFLGDVRLKDHGGFEYRTPGSFMVSKEITTAAFCLAHLVAVYHRELPSFDIYSPAIQYAFYQNDTDTLLPLIERNMEQVRNLPLYARYQDSIEPLFEMIKYKMTWDEKVDVRYEWGIPLKQLSRTKAGRPRRIRVGG